MKLIQILSGIIQPFKFKVHAKTSCRKNCSAANKHLLRCLHGVSTTILAVGLSVETIAQGLGHY